jgi:hypothetical protein
MLFFKYLITSIATTTLLVSVAHADSVTLPKCPPSIPMLQDTQNMPNVFFQEDGGDKLITRKETLVYLDGFSFFNKDNGLVYELAPNRNTSTESEYIFGAGLKGELMFACGYEGGALLFHTIPTGSIKSCVIRDNLKRTRSVSCK